MRWRGWFDWYQCGSGTSNDGEEVLFSPACAGKVLTLYIPFGGQSLVFQCLLSPLYLAASGKKYV